jgi:hypothetical protein
MRIKKIKIPELIVEQDIIVVLPDGREVTLQYRNYEGNDRGEGASLDILLPKPMLVYNWIGSDMKPAKNLKGKGYEGQHVADQLCIPL